MCPSEPFAWSFLDSEQKEHVCVAWGEMGMQLKYENTSSVDVEFHLWPAVVFEWLIKLHLSLLIG